MAGRLLLIDDDSRLTAMLATWLGQRGFIVESRADGLSGVTAAVGGKWDAVVLDVMLPDIDGFEVCRRIRAASDVPIVMLTARGEEIDRIVGLEIGADDYLPKPFNPRELAARLSAVLRRTSGSAKRGPLQFGELVIDRDRREVHFRGELQPLTAHQFDILRVLAESAGKALSRDELMQRVRGEALEAFDRSIDVHISRIRAAIGDDGKHPKRILTLRGTGYLFVADPEA